MSERTGFRRQLPFPVASVFIFIYFCIDITNRFITDTKYREDFLWEGALVPWFEYVNRDYWVFIGLLFVLAVLLLIKIPNPGITVVLGLLTALELYWYVLNLSSSADILIILTSCLSFIGMVFLTVLSMSTYTRARLPFFSAIWFLPALFEFTNTTVFLCYDLSRINSGTDVENTLRYLLGNIFYSLVILHIGRWLVTVSRIRHQAATPRPASVYTQSPYYAPAPGYDPTAYDPARNTQPPTDPIEELKRYKDLLDDGVITQEEYDAKKKQLLEL